MSCQRLFSIVQMRAQTVRYMYVNKQRAMISMPLRAEAFLEVSDNLMVYSMLP